MLENGTYVFKATDNAGNEGRLEYKVDNIDKTAGKVTHVGIEGMATDKIVTNTGVILDNIVVDSDDISKVIFSNTNTGKPTATSDGWVPYTEDMKMPWVLDISTGNGTKTIYAWAMDEVGNISDEPYVLEVILKTKLIGGVNNKVNLAIAGIDLNYGESTLTFAGLNITVGENGPALTYASGTLDKDSTQYIKDNMTGEKFDITLTNIAGVGNIYINVAGNTLSDIVGNTNDNTTLQTDVYVDTNAPVISVTGTTFTVVDNENNLLAVTINGELVEATNGVYGPVSSGDVIKVYDKAGNVVETRI